MNDYLKNNTNIIIFIAISLLVICILVLSSVPPISRDALTHHLYVPKIYIEQGGIKELPDIQFSYYPMNLDLIYMVPLFFNNDIIPKFIHFFFGLLTALLIYGYLKKRVKTRYALFGSLFFINSYYREIINQRLCRPWPGFLHHGIIATRH